MKNSERIHFLEQEIIRHKELYYSGVAEISDENYDKLEQELQKLNPESFALQLVGTDSKVNKVSHKTKMLSLDKTYSLDDLKSWIGDHKVLSVFKIDGSSCSLVYKNGILEIAKTRGDGSYGEDVTKKIKWINSIPKEIPVKGEVEIRGEVYCNEKMFFELCNEMEKLNLEKPSSQRNIVAGLLGRKENIFLSKFLSFKAFDVLASNIKIESEEEKYKLLKSFKFDIPEYEVHVSAKSLEKVLDDTKNFMLDGDYLIDGLVFVYNDFKLHEELGVTSHHPRYKIAFKFKGDSKITLINEIEWNVSRTGRLTPVALVEPVELSGAMIGRVSLHNVGVVKEFELTKGSKIEIIRSGEVIPKFLSVVEKSKNKLEIPEVCHSCNSKLSEEEIFLICLNPECPEKMMEEMLYFIQQIGIEDLSEKRLLEMIRVGLVKKVQDLFKIKENDFLKLDKVKDKLANKMFTEIQNSKKIGLIQFITALGIEGLSSVKAEKIVANGFNTISKITEMNVSDLQNINGFAEKSANDIVESLKMKKKLISDLLKIGFDPASELKVTSNKLNGKKICITGSLSMVREEMEKLIKENGGVMVSSVSKNTDILLTNETNSSSSKFKKAIELKVEINTEQQILKLLQG
jgi:DNA ligase (NAD+)